jgi:isoleucyl-tRNA synthetase
MNNFYDVYNYVKNINKQVSSLNTDVDNCSVNVLAWTTTPWTLPSNMFLAVGKDIKYYMVYDKNSNEYYILAENLIKQYYKDSNEYILIKILK